ncbi:MAG: c-type cytochrome [Planctomycetota bacterium]|jgi:YVTN family beta-propeller protein
MRQFQLRRLWLAGSLCVLSTLVAKANAGKNPYLSPLALVADNDRGNLYIACATSRQVIAFDVRAAKVTKVFPLPVGPSGIAIAPDNSRLYVTGASAKGKVCIIDPKRGKVVGRVSAGHTPNAPVVAPDGKILYVCNRFNNSVSVIKLKNKKVVSEIEVTREPVAAAITPDGAKLLVANLLPAGAADQDYAAAAVTVIDTAAREVAATIELPNGSTSLRDICISPDGRHAYVTHILARYQLPTTQLERGWMNTNALSVIDAREAKLVNTVLLDDVDLGAANPWGVAVTADGKYICVTHAGTHELSVIDRTRLHEKLEKVEAGQKVSDVSLSVADVPNDLSFLVGLRRRLKLAGNGPRGLVIVDTKAYVAEYFCDTLGVVDIEPEVASRPRSLTLGQETPMTAERRGEMLFNNAELCFQHWQSCASCHPDARADGLNWDLLNDGMGNPKNTRNMLLAHKTPPAMSRGVRGSAETAVRSGIRHIQFTVRPDADAAAIDEYLKSLKPVPSPYLVKGKLSRAAKRGSKVFEKAGCSSCHTAPLYTDLEKYDVGTGRDMEEERSFDTPTLIEVWRTAPYLYDGRAVDLKEVLTKYNHADKHGIVSTLTDKQINDLLEFVLSL